MNPNEKIKQNKGTPLMNPNEKIKHESEKAMEEFMMSSKENKIKSGDFSSIIHELVGKNDKRRLEALDWFINARIDIAIQKARDMGDSPPITPATDVDIVKGILDNLMKDIDKARNEEGRNKAVLDAVELVYSQDNIFESVMLEAISKAREQGLKGSNPSTIREVFDELDEYGVIKKNELGEPIRHIAECNYQFVKKKFEVIDMGSPLTNVNWEKIRLQVDNGNKIKILIQGKPSLQLYKKMEKKMVELKNEGKGALEGVLIKGKLKGHRGWFQACTTLAITDIKYAIRNKKFGVKP